MAAYVMKRSAYIKYIWLPVITSYSSQIASSSTWTYKGQDQWPKYCTIGKQQSPININIQDVVWRKGITPLCFKNLNEKFEATLVNNGKTIRITIPPENTVAFSGAGLKDSYRFYNLHFHWPSEHQINGENFDLEAHMVFYSSLYPNIKEALNVKHGVAVIGKLYQVTSRKGSRIFQCISQEARKVSKKVNSPTTINDFTLKCFLNEKDNFYFYQGSLTTPDCNEGIGWIILKDIDGITKNEVLLEQPLQIDYYRQKVELINGVFCIPSKGSFYIS